MAPINNIVHIVLIRNKTVRKQYEDHQSSLRTLYERHPNMRMRV